MCEVRRQCVQYKRSFDENGADFLQAHTYVFAYSELYAANKVIHKSDYK